MGILDYHLDILFSEEAGATKKPGHHFIQRQSSRQNLVKDFQKSQKTKQSWVKNRITNMFAIRKWHKSFAGKKFHRQLGRYLAIHNFIPKAGASIGRPNKSSTQNESNECCTVCEHWLNMPVDILLDVLKESGDP